MPVLAYIHQLFDAEHCQTYIHTLRWISVSVQAVDSQSGPDTRSACRHEARHCGNRRDASALSPVVVTPLGARRGWRVEGAWLPVWATPVAARCPRANHAAAGIREEQPARVLRYRHRAPHAEDA